MGDGNIFVKVNGKSFHCDATEPFRWQECGANVFHREGERIVCNSCGARYIGERRTDLTEEEK